MRSAAPLQKRPFKPPDKPRHTPTSESRQQPFIRPRPSLASTNLGPGPDTNRDHIASAVFDFFFFFKLHLFILVSLPARVLLGFFFFGAVLVPQSRHPRRSTCHSSPGPQILDDGGRADSGRGEGRRGAGEASPGSRSPN